MSSDPKDTPLGEGVSCGKISAVPVPVRPGRWAGGFTFGPGSLS